eukprot:4091871-Lingulodinium_polyedra.AAC.1
MGKRETIMGPITVFGRPRGIRKWRCTSGPRDGARGKGSNPAPPGWSRADFYFGQMSRAEHPFS